MNETITLNKVEYPILFGINAVRKFSEETKVNIHHLQIAIETRFDYQLLAIFISIQEGCRKAGKELDLTIDDFVDFVDEDPAILKKVGKIIGKQVTMVVSKLAPENGALSKNVKSPKK